ESSRKGQLIDKCARRDRQTILLRVPYPTQRPKGRIGYYYHQHRLETSLEQVSRPCRVTIRPRVVNNSMEIFTAGEESDGQHFAGFLFPLKVIVEGQAQQDKQ